MKRFLQNSCIFLFIISIISMLLELGISSRLQNDTYSRLYSGWNYIYDDTTYHDVIINGSSRAWVQYNPCILDTILNTNSYNLGTENGMINRQILRYKKYCQFHKVPSLLIQNIDYFTMTSVSGYEVEQYYPYFYDRDFLNELNKYENFSWKEKYIPIYRYLGKNRLLFLDDDNLYKGYKGRDLHWNDEALNSIASFRAEQDTMMQKEFKCFLSHNLNQGTKILFVYAPSYYKVMQKLENVDEMYKMYESIATEFNIPILDYSYDLMCDDTTYFYNGTHLNKLGAEVFTTKLAHDIDSLGLLK